MSASLLPPCTKICVYRNGDRNFFGKPYVVNRRFTPDMERLLDSVTANIGESEPVRYLCTPIGGHKVDDVDQLEHAKNYVAVCKGKFQLLPYSNLETEHSEWMKQCSRRRLMNINPALKSKHKTNKTHDFKTHDHVIKPSPGGVSIFVYLNGLMYEQPRRIFLPDHILSKKWHMVCDELSERLAAPFGAVKGLYTLDGSPAKGRKDLEPNGYYVAVGRYTAFQHISYGAFRPPFTVMAKVQITEPEPVPWRLATVNEDDSDKAESEMVKSPPKKQKPRRLPPVRVIYADGRSVFHAKPIAHKRSKSKASANNDSPFKDGASGSSVYRAKDQRDETKDAEMVEDNVDTQVDEPEDYKEPHEVEEEDETPGVEQHGSGDGFATSRQDMSDDSQRDMEEGTLLDQHGSGDYVADRRPSSGDGSDHEDANAGGDNPDHHHLSDRAAEDEDNHEHNSPGVEVLVSNDEETEPGVRPEDLIPPVTPQLEDVTNAEGRSDASVGADSRSQDGDSPVSPMKDGESDPNYGEQPDT